MKKQLLWFAAQCGAGVLGLTLMTSVSYGAFASLSTWTGLNNTSGTNNYTASSTSAGGTFQERVTPSAHLSDDTLVGSGVGSSTVFDFTENLSVSGTLSFTNPNNVDPNIFFGFYNSAGTTVLNTQRLGLAFADQAVNQFRSQMQGGNGTAIQTATLDTNGSAAGGTGPISSGTYAFSLGYVASTGVFTATVGSVFNTLTLAPGTFQVAGNADKLDRFGFLQFNVSNTATVYTLNVSNINYNGETQVPEPSTLALLGCVAPLTLRLLRRTNAPV